MYSEDDLLPLSALQHLLFCPRQCALIHVEQLWAENFFTAQGRVMHERVHEEKQETRGDIVIQRGIPLRSLQLGLIGKSDVVEMHPGKGGIMQPYPVEYKRGRSKPDDCDRVQLCAQALCLEEMLNVSVSEGAIFYGKTRRKEQVLFDDVLREKTVKACAELQRLFNSGVTPEANYTEKCNHCSLVDICLPKAVVPQHSTQRYIQQNRDAYEKTS